MALIWVKLSLYLSILTLYSHFPSSKILLLTPPFLHLSSHHPGILLLHIPHQKERTSSYQKRWFVLKANLLFYQERPADRHLLGVIVLEGCAVQRCESEGGLFPFSMVFRGSGLKTYRLAAEDQLGQESWVKVLLTASHCYLSLLVRDLGKQYKGECVEKVWCVCVLLYSCFKNMCSFPASQPVFFLSLSRS